jgi:hypothetical protein
LAVALFLAGRGVNLQAAADGTTPLAIAQEVGNAAIIQLFN